jgi:hypothetical protein
LGIIRVELVQSIQAIQSQEGVQEVGSTDPYVANKVEMTSITETGLSKPVSVEQLSQESIQSINII